MSSGQNQIPTQTWREYAKRVLGVLACKLIYGGKCPHIPSIGRWWQ